LPARGLSDENATRGDSGHEALQVFLLFKREGLWRYRGRGVGGRGRHGR
jgi:hypothetical protein